MSLHPTFVCGYCRGTDSLPGFACIDVHNQTWHWRACTSCEAVSLTPRPSPPQLAAAYGPAYYGQTGTKFKGLAERFVEYCRRARARRLARGLPQKAAVLDVGCGNGGFLSALSIHGDFQLFGTELDGPAARRAGNRPCITLKVGALAQGDFADNSLDLITLFHVFEHLEEPRETLAAIHRALKPGGHLVMSFPNIASIQAKMFRGHWLHLDPPRHLFLFPSGAFAKALAAAGFTIVGRVHFAIEQNPYGFIQSALNALLPVRDLLFERLKGNTGYAPGHGSGSLLLQKAFAGLVLGPAIGLDALESALGCGATVEYTLIKQNPITPCSETRKSSL